MGRSLRPPLALCGGAGSEVTSELGQTLTVYPHSHRNIIYASRVSSQILRDTMTSNWWWCYSSLVRSFESEHLQMGLSKDRRRHRPQARCQVCGETKWDSSTLVIFISPVGGDHNHSRGIAVESKDQ